MIYVGQQDYTRSHGSANFKETCIGGGGRY